MGLEEGQPLRRTSDHAKITKAAAGRPAAGTRPHGPSSISAAGFQQAPARGGAGRGRTGAGEHVGRAGRSRAGGGATGEHVDRAGRGRAAA